MTLEQFLTRLQQQPESIQFSETMAIIEQYYDYQPTGFRNGLGDNAVMNAAGSNEGSCKIFAFAMLHQLPADLTLHLFGDYYRQDVLAHPQATDHQNIRQFMQSGWDGIQFDGPALSEKNH